MDMVEIAVEELQFELDLMEMFFAEPAMEDSDYVPVEDTNPTEGKTKSEPVKADVADADDKSGKSTNPKMYDVNKNRDATDKRDFIAKIENFFKMIGEMIERAIAKIREKLARIGSGQKSFAKEVAKIEREKVQPNFKLKCKNYLYNDNFLAKFEKVLATYYGSIKIQVNNVMREFNEAIKTSDTNTDDEYDSELEKKFTEPFQEIGKLLGIHGELGGNGDLFNAARRMYRGSEEVVEFALSSKPEEFKKARDFLSDGENGYDSKFNKIMNAIDVIKKDFEPFQRQITRAKNANINKTGKIKNINARFKQLSKSVTFTISCYSFIGSLLQERLYNCRNLFRRAYGLL